MANNNYPDIMNLRELIDTAFGDFQGNTVNFKLVETILYILARHMRLLERRVQVELASLPTVSSDRSLSITEVKIHAIQRRKKKPKDEGHKGAGGKLDGDKKKKSTRPLVVQPKTDKYYSDKTPTTETTADRTSVDKTSQQKTASDKISTDKTSTDKTFSDKTTTDKTFTGKTSTDKTSTDKTSTDNTFTDKTSSDKTSTVKTSTDKSSTAGTSTYKTSTDKSATDKTSTDKTSTDKTSTDKTSTDKTSTDKTTSDKTSTGKTSTGKTSTDKTSSDKTSTGKTSTDKTSTGKTSTDKTSIDKTSTGKTLNDKTSTSKTSTSKTYTDKTSIHKTSIDKTSIDKTSIDKTSIDKTSIDKTSIDKTSIDKTSIDKTLIDKTSTDKTSIDKTSTDKISIYKTSTDKTSIDKLSTDKTSTDKTSIDRTSTDKTATDKIPTDKTSAGKTSTDKIFTDKTSTEKSSSKTTSSKQDQKKTGDPAGKRTTKQASGGTQRKRADSFEETTKTPTPMASVGSMEAQYEKILVVERVPSAESRRSADVQGQRRSPQISVVTQEQFEQLSEAVRQLQKRLMPIGTPVFPEHAELMEELRRGASLTDAMAALQLSARLEAIEQALEKMIPMVTELAQQTGGIDLDDDARFPEAQGGASKAPGYGKYSEKSQDKDPKKSQLKDPKKSYDKDPKKSYDKDPKKSYYQDPEKSLDKDPKKVHVTSEETAAASKSFDFTEMTSSVHATADTEVRQTEDDFVLKPVYITRQDLKDATKELFHKLMKKAEAITARTNQNATSAFKLATNLDGKVEMALTVTNRMSDLENAVSQYADAITALDTGLSSQMTNYQEQLTQMQHDLEIGLDTMAEVLGTSGGDTVAMAELNSHFTSLQLEFDNMMYSQKELRDAQDSKAYDLENLWKEIEMLRDTKADREEVADALRDKAGIGELNGLVSLCQFDAVRGDFEKRIAAAYDKFNNQEIVWQKAIDDLLRVLNVKADIVQVNSLESEINKYLTIMKDRMQILIDIVGEPKSAMLSKKLFRNTACLSCGSPAHMDKEEPNFIPALPAFYSARQPGEGAEKESKSKGDGDHKICYTDFPIPHPRDPRSHVCQRYCGGSHTKITEGPARVPPLMIVLQPTRQINTELGTDGKVYLVDEVAEKVPCLPCNKPKLSSPQTSKHDQATPAENEGDGTPPLSSQNQYDFENISVTPPAHEFEASE